MIQSYRDKRTSEFAEGKRVREFEGFRRQAEKRLDILDAATSLSDLQALPSNALEGLKGDRKGQLSLVLYAIAIPLAFVNQWISDAIYVAVAAIWLVPDTRIEGRLKA